MSSGLLYLVEVFPRKERLVSCLFEEGGESLFFRGLLPEGAAAVSFDGVIESLMVVGVTARQDGGTARTTQRVGHELKGKYVICCHDMEMISPSLALCEGNPPVIGEVFIVN